MAKKYTEEEDPLGAFTSGGGNSTPTEKALYKQYRGEQLTSEEWKIIRELKNNDPYTQMTKGYEVAPF